MTRPKNILGQPALNRIREESSALKRLADLEEAMRQKTSEGSFRFSAQERQIVKSIRHRHNETLELTYEQRERIKQLWELVRKGRLTS